MANTNQTKLARLLAIFEKIVDQDILTFKLVQNKTPWTPHLTDLDQHEDINATHRQSFVYSQISSLIDLGYLSRVGQDRIKNPILVCNSDISAVQAFADAMKFDLKSYLHK